MAFTTATNANKIETKDIFTEVRYSGVIVLGLPFVTRQTRTVTRIVRRYVGIDPDYADNIATSLSGANKTVSVEVQDECLRSVTQTEESFSAWVNDA